VSVQDRPVCFGCTQVVEHSPVYAAPCDHDRCPSVVFHGLCLMRWREARDEALARARAWAAEHLRGGPKRKPS
jgi:hypothetical protein